MFLKHKRWMTVLAVFLAGTVLLGLAVLTIRNLGALFGMLDGVLGTETSDQLAAIFGQLRNAQLRMGLLPMCGILAGYLLLLLFVKRKRLMVWLSPVFAAAAYLSAVLFACVNDILFFDILKSLAAMAKNGLFDKL